MKNSTTWSPKSIKIDFEIDSNGCFNCTSHKPGKRGYPRTHRGVVYRHIYEQMKGEIPNGLVVRHTCDNKLCINPEHLILGTQAENYQDALDRNRLPKGSKKPNAILDEQKVVEIKWLLKHSNLTQKAIGERFGVTRKLINRINCGYTWVHVK